MSAPFKHGLLFAFTFSALLYVIAALCSWRGGSKVAPDNAELPAAAARKTR
jgi:hypothetical protein